MCLTQKIPVNKPDTGPGDTGPDYDIAWEHDCDVVLPEVMDAYIYQPMGANTEWMGSEMAVNFMFIQYNQWNILAVLTGITELLKTDYSFTDNSSPELCIW